MADLSALFLPVMFLTGALLFVALFIGLAVYIYLALAWMTIASKLKHKHPWLAWIPFANIALVLQLGGFHWAWIFLVLVPVLGWLAIAVMAIVSVWRIYEKRRYPGWLALIYIGSFIPLLNFIAGIANLVIIGLVAWKDN
jgi:hypothetical protein